jgi:hypothetical protein
MKWSEEVEEKVKAVDVRGLLAMGFYDVNHRRDGCCYLQGNASQVAITPLELLKFQVSPSCCSDMVQYTGENFVITLCLKKEL